MRKSNQSITKSSNTNLNVIETGKLLGFQLYHQEMLANINFWLGKMFYQKKQMLKKAATMKRFEYLPLGKEFKAQADISKKQYQKLDNTYELHKIIKKEKSTLEDYSNLDLMYKSNYSFYECYSDI